MVINPLAHLRWRMECATFRKKEEIHVSRTTRPCARAPRLAALLLALGSVGATVPGAAQGIYPGDAPKDAYTLPGGFEPVLQLRTYYFDQDNTSGVQSEAWALGGWAGLRSPWWGDLFQAGIVGYTSQKLYGPDGKGGTRLLTADQDSITVLGEAFGAVRIAGQTITGYRQLVNRPFINPQDNRMVPNTVEAYTLAGSAKDVSYIGGYITKEKVRDTESFRWMSNVAGGDGEQKGVAFAGGTYSFAKTGYVRLDEQYAIDVFNTFYADVRYPIALDDRTGLTLGAQYFPQTSVGDEQIGSFSTWGYGLQAALARGGFGVQLYWTQTGEERDTLEPVRHPPVVPRHDAGVVQHRGREGVGDRRELRLRRDRGAGPRPPPRSTPRAATGSTTAPGSRWPIATRRTSAWTGRRPRGRRSKAWRPRSAIRGCSRTGHRRPARSCAPTSTTR